jgi:transaldolase
VRSLSEHGIKVNVTALMTVPQVEGVVTALADSPSAYVSVFAGRIADAGVDPLPTMVKALDILRPHAQLELIWASPREVFNVVQADEIGCHIITVTHDLLAKLPTLGKDLDEFSLDTVKMFHGDAVAAGYVL